MHAPTTFLSCRSRTARPRGRFTKRPDRRAGFSLLEVMIASIVLALAITTSITTMQRAFLTLDSARKITLAGQILQSEFEKIRLDDWATIDALPATADITTAVKASFDPDNTSAAITSSFIITRAVSEVHADMKQITLTLAWSTLDGRVRSRSYTTYYGKNGLYDYYYNSY